jgi:hypothetical protein
MRSWYYLCIFFIDFYFKLTQAEILYSTFSSTIFCQNEKLVFFMYIFLFDFIFRLTQLEILYSTFSSTIQYFIKMEI